MKILAHRGYWKVDTEKNRLVAFERAFALGFGIETDIRDASQGIVVSHDRPTGGEMSLDHLLAIAASYAIPSRCTLALNIKSDGIADLLEPSLARYPALDVFVFDMSVPDMRSYILRGTPVFTRISDAEREPVWIEDSSGIWLDAFESEWYSEHEIERCLMMDKRVCIVSPELHRRPYEGLWEILKRFSSEEKILLCTDFPEAAKNFFGISG